MKLISPKQKLDTSYHLRRTIALHAGFLVIVAIIFPAMILFAGFTGTAHHLDDTNGMLCFSDGSAHLFGKVMAPLRAQAWVPSLFLSITLGFGSLTFPAAKGIDIAWDLLVERGGQLCLTALTYPLAPTSFRLFSSVAFGGVSVSSLYALSSHRRRASKSPHDWMSTWLYAALALMTLYILAFPTLVSIMSGYQSKLTPYAKDPDDPNNLLPVHDLRIPHLVVLDGQRLGLGNHFPVESTSPGVSDARTVGNCKWLFHKRRLPQAWLTPMSDAEAVRFLDSYLVTDGNLDFPVSQGINYEMRWEKQNGITYVPPKNQVYDNQANNISSGVSFSFLSNATSLEAVWSNITLQAYINRTAYLSPPPLDIVYNDPDLISRDAEQYLWAGDTMYNRSWLLASTVCQPSSGYQWGFSGGMLLLFACATALYTVLAVNLHWLVYRHSRADRYAHTFSVYRDVLDLAGELRLLLGDEVDTLSGSN
ncbi:hypothetical protein LTR97_011330 [Elasticomyces elasticus]|uniref:Transmembrane protein n=1 Tax=Elasticomyces elasticus TaxID=574655 RepID=A0AAN7W893_9PEZI|nr:hypothetical protein LTR97_011330 [Elasticomyces elasticus]